MGHFTQPKGLASTAMLGVSIYQTQLTTTKTLAKGVKLIGQA
jgi:hypothetical protein